MFENLLDGLVARASIVEQKRRLHHDAMYRIDVFFKLLVFSSTCVKSYQHTSTLF